MRRIIVSTRRWRSVVSLLAALTVVASACGSASTDTTADTSGPDSQDVAAPAVVEAPEVAAADANGGDDTDAASDTDAAVDADADTEADAPADAASQPVAPAVVSVEGAAAAAEVNIGLVQSNDDVRLVEVIDVASGSITNLAAAVTGDRPVLLWFWAPH